jgi:hypothetical protein
MDWPRSTQLPAAIRPEAVFLVGVEKVGKTAGVLYLEMSILRRAFKKLINFYLVIIL